MKTVDCKVLEIEHVRIPMPDGTHLAARIWMPEDAGTHPVPAILEYTPYRKNDLCAWRDSLSKPFTAAYGYACVRLDCRGAGESDGILKDEYLQQELNDGRDAVDWIAAQSWCDGNVGMIGISWGGFNSLQIAAMQPPALKAIITVSSTDDRYADDVHYMGGCLLNDNFSWASVMFGQNTWPPDPRLVGEGWRDTWLDRLEQSGLWLKHWMNHPTRDEYWRHGSVCEDYGQIRCPVYAVGGWADGYVNAVFRMLQGLKVPRKGLVGPWAHTYPHMGKPGPPIGFLQETVRWWDYWLKGRDNGIMREPMLRAWIQEPAAPCASYAQRAGRWVAENTWPSPTTKSKDLFLTPQGGLCEAAEHVRACAGLPVSSPLSIGLLAGKWCSYAVPGDQPSDQRAEDAGSLVFETAPLCKPLEILGQCMVELELESDQPAAMIAVRFNSVAPDGAATRVTYGLLDLTHRDGHEHPEPMIPGKRYRISVPLKHVGQRFATGYRLRLALSTSYWPVAWVPPERATLTIHTGTARVILPTRAVDTVNDQLAPFLEAAGSRPQPREEIEPAKSYWRIVQDLSHATNALEIRSGIGTLHLPLIDLTVSTDGTERYSISEHDPNSQRAEALWKIGFARGDLVIETVTSTILTCDINNFYITAELRAYENASLVKEKVWKCEISRRLHQGLNARVIDSTNTSEISA